MEIKPMKIEYPKLETEFDVQADLYWRIITELKLDPKGELTIEVDDPPHKYIRPDLTVFDLDKTAIALIEVKRTRKKKSYKQEKRYSVVGLPFFICRGRGGIEETIEWLRKITN